MGSARLLSLSGLVAILATLASCDAQTGDEPVVPTIPPPAGKGKRVHEIADPASPTKAAHKTAVNVTGATVVAVDEYDETGTGRSSGSIYVGDLGSTAPYSGISLFNPSFVPGNLRIGPGDTLDLRGEYQENNSIPLQFPPNAFLVQLASPVATFRFDANLPEAVDIKIEELADYAKGRKWLNMLVRVKKVKIQGDPELRGGRYSAALATTVPDASTSPGCDAPFPRAPALVNELMDLSAYRSVEGGDCTKTFCDASEIKSLTGIVTFFCNLRIAPRSAADIEL